MMLRVFDSKGAPWARRWRVAASEAARPPRVEGPRRAALAQFAVIGSDGTRVGQNLQCAPVLPCDGPFFRAGAVRYNKTFVHAKFEVNPSTWAASRTVDVSRFRVGRRAATAGGGRAAAVRSPPLGGGRRLRSPPRKEAVTASGRRRPQAVTVPPPHGDRLREAVTACPNSWAPQLL